MLIFIVCNNNANNDDCYFVVLCTCWSSGTVALHDRGIVAVQTRRTIQFADDCFNMAI